VSNEIEETLCRSHTIPDVVDEEELMGELDALEANTEFKLNSVPSYLQQDKERPPRSPAAGFFDLENGNRRSRLTSSTSTSTLQCDAADGGSTPSGSGGMSWSP
jgi:hypothetical protein